MAPPPRRTVIVRFRPGLSPPFSDSAASDLGPPWAALLLTFPGLVLRRRIRSISPSQLLQMAGPGHDASAPGAATLLRTFEVRCPEPAMAPLVAAALRWWPNVESAYVMPGFQPAGTVYYAANPLWDGQGYLKPAPLGVNAFCAWQLNGGDGANRMFADIEGDWSLDHRDLPAGVINPALVYGNRSGSADDQVHGLWTLGVVCAADNDYDCVGFAPKIATVRLASYINPQEEIDHTHLDNAITAVAQQLKSHPGSVILLEVEKDAYASPANGCVDLIPVVRHAIRAAVDQGIVVVEAAGNGDLLLDTTQDDDGKLALVVGGPAFDDSGAILVGAAETDALHHRVDTTWAGNRGSRVDCYAWGQSVKSLSGTADTSDFWGTSSAASIIAGVAVLVQGLAEQYLGAPFPPGTLRSILADPANGTESANGKLVDGIGVMPDIAKIVRNHITVAVPDVYARDFVGDDGTTGSTTTFATPDVIVRQSQTADPQASYGEGSGHEDDIALSEDVIAGFDHFVYLRARNRGGVDAHQVEARAYYAENATMLLPGSWIPIGSAIFPMIPAGDILTVSPAIQWNQADVPPTGHYCFIAEIVDPCRPTSAKTDMADFATFVHFVQNENNVVWRNFNVVQYDPLAPDPTGVSTAVPTPSGSKETFMRVLLEAALPAGAVVLVRAPFPWLRRTSHSERAVRALLHEGFRVPPVGRTELLSGMFPPGTRTQVEIVVTMPRQEVARGGWIAVKQLGARGPLGRATWRFVPRQARASET